ncbi:MAG TPA: arginase family protein [Vicinamibacterales bacterium]|nr:arginase family protein [Vicinamibacterales bacterium]
MPRDDLSLLLPEWQGYGVDAAVAAGARAAAGLFGAAEFVEIDAPDQEALAVEQGVLGLASIAARLPRTLAVLDARRPSRIFTVGGTCGVELAPVSYLNARYHGDLAVVWLDAHADLNTPESSPSRHFHGMVLRTLLGAGPASLVDVLPRRLAPNQIVLAGARDLDRDEMTFVSNAALSLLTPADIVVPDRVAGRIRAGRFRRVYVHLDLDVLDPAEFPDTLVSTSGGLSVENVATVVRDLASKFEVVGFSVVEFQPRSADALPRLAQLVRRCGIEIGALSV